MKKIKLLTSLTTLPLLGVGFIPLSSCNKGSDQENQYTVKFDTQGGSSIDPVKVDKGSKVTKPTTDPTKTGYIFKGWYTDKECTNEFDFNTPITSNITLYAKWEEAVTQYTVTFDTQGGSTIDPVKVDEGSKVTKPTDPTKQGYEFKGWFTEKECTNEFDFNTSITSNITLYAKWDTEKILVTKITLEGKDYVLTNRSYKYIAKVLPEDATNKEVEWKVEVPKSSAAEANVDAEGNVTFTKHGAINLIATAKDGSGTNGTFIVWGLDETDAAAVSKYYFCNDDWSEICDYANQGYDALLDHYSGLKTLGDNPFVGLERTILINGQKHIVRVIGENHDTITGTTNKAALTFELVTLLSDSDGNKMTSNWDSTNNYYYTNSILRANLTGQGKGTKSFTNTVLSMLPTELQSSIKTVNKKIATYDSKTSEYVVSEEGYNDKLFPLTYTEMAQSGSEYAKVEGSAYKYWIDHNSSGDRIKKDINGNPYYYWVVSPYISFVDAAWSVNEDGDTDCNTVSITNGVSFGFCI